MCGSNFYKSDISYISVDNLKNDPTPGHPGQDWFIIHVKLGHSMDNGFIFKKINKN